MKHLTIILLVLITIKTSAQESAKVSSGKFQIGINYSPDICYRVLKNNDGSSTNEELIKGINKREKPKFGYTTGLNVCFNIKDFIGIETGIQYSNKGYQTKMQDIMPIDPDPLIPSENSKVKYISSFHYIDIPLKANLIIGDKKIRFFASVGVTANIFIKGTRTSVVKSSTEKTDRNTTRVNSDYKSFNLSPTIGAGIDYTINDKMHIRMEPTFRYGIFKIIDAPITDYLWNVGLNTSFFFTL